MLLSVTLTLSAAPLACLVCSQGTGQAVRASIFDGAFASTLGQVMLPAVVTGAALAVLVKFLPR